MPKRTLSEDIKKIKNLFISLVGSKKSDKYKITPQQIADDIVTGFKYGSSYNQIFIYVKNSFSDKELNDLSKIEIEITSQMILLFPKMKVGKKIAFNILLSKIETQEKQKSTNLFQEQQGLQRRDSNSSVYYDADNKEEEPLRSRRGSAVSNDSWHSENNNLVDNTQPPQIKTYPILQPIVNKKTQSIITEHTDDRGQIYYKIGNNKVENFKPYKIVYNEKDKKELDKYNYIMPLAFESKKEGGEQRDKLKTLGCNEKLDGWGEIGNWWTAPTNILKILGKTLSEISSEFSKTQKIKRDNCVYPFLPMLNNVELYDFSEKHTDASSKLQAIPRIASMFLDGKFLLYNDPNVAKEMLDFLKTPANHPGIGVYTGIGLYNYMLGRENSDGLTDDLNQLYQDIQKSVKFFEKTKDVSNAGEGLKEEMSHDKQKEKVVELCLNNKDSMEILNLLTAKEILTEYRGEKRLCGNDNIQKMFTEKTPQLLTMFSKMLALDPKLNMALKEAITSLQKSINYNKQQK
jgi:hypothetical protein